MPSRLNENPVRRNAALSLVVLLAMLIPALSARGAPDTQPPVILDVLFSTIGQTWADLNLTTDEPTAARVAYWPEAGGALTVLEDTAYSREHAFNLTGLRPNTPYSVRVMVFDGASNSDVESFTLLSCCQSRVPTFEAGAAAFAAIALGAVVWHVRIRRKRP